MFPFLYWTNLSGIYDGIIFRDSIYLATFGGILVLDKNLNQIKTYKFSDGTNSNVIVSIDTFQNRIYYLTKNKGFGYLENGKINHYPISQIPISEISGGKGIYSYKNLLFIYGEKWILYFTGSRLKSINLSSISAPISSIFIYNDTIYIGDKLGYLKTHISYFDIPASYQRVNMPQVIYINTYNGQLLFGTTKGIYDKNGNLIVGGVSAVYFESFRDTLFISARMEDSSNVYGSGILKKLKDNNIIDEPNYQEPYFIMQIDTYLIISRFHKNPLFIYVDNVAWGLYTYPNFQNFRYGFPFNYISNIITSKNNVFLFTHTDYDPSPNNLNYIAYLVNKNKIIELGDSVYRITKAVLINDSLIGVSSYFSYFLLDTLGNVRYCLGTTIFPINDDMAFTSIGIYKDSVLIGNLIGRVYKTDKICSFTPTLDPNYSNRVSPVKDIASNTNLVALGGNSGIAIFENGNIIYNNNNVSVNSIKAYNNGFIVGTSNGLYYYNGDFEQIPALSNKAITDVIVDNFNTIYALAEDGLYRLDQNFNIIEYYKISGITYLQTTNFPILKPLSILNDTLVLVGSSEGVGLVRINSLIESELIVYPNPARDYIKIKSLKGSYNYDVSILTISGKLVLRENIRSNESGEIKIDISKLDSGFYIVKISNKILKFVKI